MKEGESRKGRSFFESKKYNRKTNKKRFNKKIKKRVLALGGCGGSVWWWDREKERIRTLLELVLFVFVFSGTKE